MFAEYIIALFIPCSLVHGQVELPLEELRDVGSDCNITQHLLEKIDDLEQQNNELQDQFNTFEDQMLKLQERSNSREACFEDLANVNCTGSESGLVGIIETIRVDGGWGHYSEWSQCSATCGEGVQFRNRTCNNPSPQYGGKPCTGDSVNERKCSVEACCPEGWIRHGGQCYNCVREENIAYFRNDLSVGRNYVKTASAHECAKWCGMVEGCKYWTFRKSEHVCWLKHSNSGRRSDSDAISGTKGCAKGSKLQFQLKGKTGLEKVTISIDGNEEVIGLTPEWQTFTYPRPSSGSFSVEFHNDVGHTDVHIRGHESQVADLLPKFPSNKGWGCGTTVENERCTWLRNGDLLWSGKYTYTLKG